MSEEKNIDPRERGEVEVRFGRSAHELSLARQVGSSYFGELQRSELLGTLERLATRTQEPLFSIQREGVLLSVGAVEVHKVLEISNGRASLTASHARHKLKTESPLEPGKTYEMVIDPATNEVRWARQTDKAARELGGPVVHSTEPIKKLRAVPRKKASEFFDIVRRQPHIPFQYPANGCWARAHEMCRIIERHLDADPTDVVAKVWHYAGAGTELSARSNNTPECKVEWSYHVAPVVQQDDELWVIDPSMFDEPVPLDRWRQAQNPDNSTLAYSTWSVYFRNSKGVESAEAPYEAESDMQEMRAKLYGQIYARGPLPYKCP
ncbi:hypothetical protein EZ313_22150 [Ramlibacter henchirensis]|uniref:Protein glutaminase domain-containing protein n=1 Tax=Ramlibacter henchirensis TaxID=204072 RepID=A0A4Z0BMT6_9BURK|nr:protein-glutamine glutaminase family protein [Ramlibacter henchirensis]TFY99268.1 hypothetical protein EZ313_22150 [Ramlibacter henchirensis]